MEVSPESTTKNHPSCWRKTKRKMKKLLDHYPRLVALAKIQIWFMLLLLVSFVIGNAISQLEGPSEIKANDDYMRRSFMAKRLPIDPTIANLVALPSTCMVQFREKLQEEEQKLQRDQASPNSPNTDEDNTFSINTTSSNETILPSWNKTNSAATNIDYDIGSSIDRAIADLNYLRMEAVMLTNTNTTWAEFSKFANLTFQVPRTNTNNTSLVDTANTIDSTEYSDDLYGSDAKNLSVQEKTLGYAEACRKIAEELVLSLIDFSIEVNSLEKDLHDGSNGLSFNWIRCWNETSYGIAHFYRKTSEAQRNASLLTSQTHYFDAQWHKDRREKYDSFVAEHGCDVIPEGETSNSTIFDRVVSKTNNKDRCYWEAMMNSTLDATGAEGCIPNSASAAWFWFTVMTTVGYGNAPPDTYWSRVLVFSLGWLMIIAFGGIMVDKADTLTALLDDIFRRTNLRWLKQPKYSAPIWFVLSILYIMMVAWYARDYWSSYIPNDVFTLNDSYWFSYITLLTVGLGDFYVQPQGLFVWDVISWSFLLLYGFGILASFLDRFSNLIASWIPKRKEPLDYHLARTELFFGTGINTPYSKSLEILRELAAECLSEDEGDAIGDRPLEGKYRSSFSGRDDDARTPDGNTINLHRIKILTEKKSLLIKLLLANQAELDDRMALCELKKVYSKKDDETTGNKGKSNGSLTLSILSTRFESDISLPMPTVEELERDEEVLNSILFRTQELRRHIDNINIQDDEHVDP